MYEYSNWENAPPPFPNSLLSLTILILAKIRIHAIPAPNLSKYIINITTTLCNIKSTRKLA